MDLNYIISKRTNGANPFKIFSFIETLDADALSYLIRRMLYPKFLESSYWFAVSTVAKSNAGMRCQVCNMPDRIQVHHRTYETHGQEHKNMMDLVVLCYKCHGLFHGHTTVEFRPEGYKASKFEHKHERRAKLRHPLILPHSSADIEMPEGDPIILTRDLINKCRANGSFTNATVMAFGLNKTTMTSGWAFRLEGTALSRAQYRKAQEGRFIYRQHLPREIPLEQAIKEAHL